MKYINAGRTLKLTFGFCLFMGLAQAKHVHAGEYYIYQDPDGKLVISNKPPPPGSKIIKQQTLPEVSDNQIQPTQEPDDMQLKGDNDGSLKPPKKNK